MRITLEIPDDIGQHLEDKWGHLSGKLLESFAVEAYDQNLLTSAQIQTLLKLPSRWATEEFLKHSQAYLDYTEEDLKEDLQTIRNLLGR